MDAGLENWSNVGSRRRPRSHSGSAVSRFILARGMPRGRGETGPRAGPVADDRAPVSQGTPALAPARSGGSVGCRLMLGGRDETPSQ